MNPFDPILNFYYSALDYFQSSGFAQIIFWAKIVSFCISFLLIFAMIILLSRSRAVWWISERIDSFRKVKLPEKTERNWQRIKERMEKGDEANIKLALLEADGILDEILKRMGLEGKDMSERLEKLNLQQMTSLNEIWDAHRLRNLVVHQPQVMLMPEQVQKAIGAYEKALKELEVI